MVSWWPARGCGYSSGRGCLHPIIPQDTFGSSDPFLRISRVTEEGGKLPVLKTEVIRNNLNPRWRPIQLTMQQLCNSDAYRPLLLECFDWNASGALDLIGQAQLSLDDMVQR